MSSNVNLAQRLSIAQSIVGAIDERGFCACPGAHLHSGKTRGNHCRIMLDGVPTIDCRHGSCQGAVADANNRLRSEIGKAEFVRNGPARPATPSQLPAPAPAPKPERAAAQFSNQYVKTLAGRLTRCPSFADLIAASPAPIPDGNTTHLGKWMIDQLYPAGDRLLVFTNFYSQGEFLVESGRGTYRLAGEPGVQAVASPLPVDGREGVWFLTAPVSGKWEPSAVSGKHGRRHAGCATAYRYAVLESDNMPPDEWLKVLVQLELPIAAVYTSGGRSVHALVRMPDETSKERFDAAADILKRGLAPLGVDPAAITAVRLSRLPGCYRLGADKAGKYEAFAKPALQQLLYVNPAADFRPILSLLPW